MKYIRTKDGRIKNRSNIICFAFREDYFSDDWDSDIEKYLGTKIVNQADTIEELCDEIVLIENGNERNIVYLQEAYDRIDDYHNQNNYEPRLIGRIKVGLDKKAVAEWKENKQGFYNWILL